MANFKNIKTGAVISSSTYYSLSSYERNNYGEIDSSGDFLTSAVIGALTGSAIIGGIVGGSIEGGIVGDLLDGDLFD
jgi:hypothetical protein